MIPVPVPSMLLMLVLIVVPAFAIVGTVVALLMVFHARVVIGGRWWPRPVGWGTRLFWLALAMANALMIVAVFEA